ncbi:MAG: M14 family metallopeptidase [Bacilli bacterium]|nr:M14 family metallopeptidase [Bacilli bacterium]
MKLILKLILIIVIIIGTYIYVFKERCIFIYKDINDKITFFKEDDSDIITAFTKGMKTHDYYKTLTDKPYTLSKTSDIYQNINYDFEKHLHYNEIEKLINNLNKSDSTIISVIGSSVDKRSIYSIEIGYGSNTILFDAGIHAAEVAGPLFIIKYLIDLVNDYENNEDEAINIINNYKIIIIPCINPDGYEATLFGTKYINNKNLYIYQNRKDIIFKTYKGNANGVDLNRNFPSQHGGLYYSNNILNETVSLEPTLGYFDYFPGTRLGSEPETKAVMSWLENNLNNASAYISLHSAGRVIYSGKPNLSAAFNNKSLRLAKIVSQVNNYTAYDKTEEEVGYGNDGTSTDYASEIISDFKFSKKTGRLSASSYQNPKIKEVINTGIITLETLSEYTFDLNIIKEEYYNQKLYKVFTKLIKNQE